VSAPAMKFRFEAPAQVLYPMFDPHDKWFIFGLGRSAEFYSLDRIQEKGQAADVKPDFAIESGTSVSAHWNLDFSPDSRWMVNRGNNEPLRIWWLKPDGHAQLTGEASDQEGYVSVKFTSDSKQLISSQGRTTSIWTLNTETGGVVRETIPGGGDILLHPDARHITIFTADGPRTWSLQVEELVALARRNINRNLTLTEWRNVLPSAPYGRIFDDLPDDVSVIQDLVERANADAAAGNTVLARHEIELAAGVAIASKNPFATERVAQTALALDMPDLALAPANAAVQALPGDPSALRYRGRAFARTGNAAGVADLQAYLTWATSHGASPEDISWEQNAVRLLVDGKKPTPD
jgi:hypothetical protein